MGFGRMIVHPDTITALMLYYGRRNVAEEAIESFLRQTYPHKRLIIVNTHPDPVWFEEDRPEIEVHNIIPNTFANLNAKYNYAFTQVKTRWWAPWDSDDIWLPWHWQNLADNIKNLKESTYPGKVGINKSYFAKNNVIKAIGWQMWGDCIFETFDKDGNRYPKCDQNSPDNCDRQIVFKGWNRFWIRPPAYPISFIFRWHDSGHGSTVTGEEGPTHHAKLREKMYAIRNSEPFKPHWDRDYVKDVEEFEKSGKKYVLANTCSQK